MKKLLFLIALMTMSFYVNLNANICSYHFTATAELRDDCCIDITVTNINTGPNECDTIPVKFQKLQANGSLLQTEELVTLNSGESYTYTMCSEPGESVIRWAVFIGYINNGNHNYIVGTPIDISDCCECPIDKTGWLTFDIAYNSPDCDSGQCKVTPILNIPDSITCYKYYSGQEYGFDDDWSVIKTVETPLPSYCVDYGETIEYFVTLMKEADGDSTADAPINCNFSAFSEPCGVCDCPENKDEWLTFTIDYNSPDCDSGQCKVTPILNIPDSNTCFKYYSGWNVDIENDWSTSQSIETQLPSYCVDYRETIEYWVTLMKWSDGDSLSNCTVTAVSEPCSECDCPDNKNDWLTFSIEYESPDCDSGQCKVTPILDIPDSINCFKYYSIWFYGIALPIYWSANTPIGTALPSYCVNYGKVVDFNISLMSNATDDPNADYNCIVSGVSEPCYQHETPPCISDPCLPENSDWVLNSIEYSPPNCNDCKITLYYLKYNNESCRKTWFYVRDAKTEGDCSCMNEASLFYDAIINFYDFVVKDEWEVVNNVVELDLSSCWELIYPGPFGNGYYGFCGYDCCKYEWDPINEFFNKTFPIAMMCNPYPVPEGECWTICGDLFNSPPDGWSEPSSKINFPSDFKKIFISPNPAKDIVFIQLPEIEGLNIDIEIYGINGELLYNKYNTRGELVVNIRNWANGTYFVKIYLNEQEINKSYKFIILK